MNTTGHPSGDFDVLDIDPYSEESLRNPSSYASAIRETGRAVWIPRYQMWAVGRYEHAKAALDNWRVFVNGFGTGLNDGPGKERWRPPSLLLETDPPDHERYRNALAPAVASFRARRPELEARAAEFVDRLVAARSFDAVSDLAEPFVTRVFGDAVGLPHEGRENLLPYSDLAFNSFGPANWLVEAARESGGGAVEWVTEACKRKSLTSGGMGAMAFAAVDAGTIEEWEAERLVRSFLTAGLDTTVNTIASTLRYLSADPEQWGKLHANPGLARQAFEETLRFESTASIVYRCVDADIELAGAQMKKGDKLMISVMAANHDPAQFKGPERFDIERRTPSVGFGWGIHTCIGQMIARTEGEILLGALAKRVARLESAGEPVRRLNNTVRGFGSVPVIVKPA
ncbi:cytochrome P450 [Burkholderia sp. Bp9142]|uniref:cytochrome P450 n=1 Tax=Burkholderia sp. Bp9142 TaxID=2184573 RepID=UPI000F5A068E|nr:cytochrome P450 [Burkholderia sp. Bp9142]RQR24596.1 cytochrome P450 [Burkholderia sp. Bp9142]